MKKGLLIALTAAGAAVPASSWAHHAFSAQFSRDLPVEITGRVSKVEWMNPHARFYVEAEDENGETVEWNFELASPNALMRQGWRHDSLEVGDEITVEGFRARNSPNVANAGTVKLANGEELFGRNARDPN
jgi:hypothetical protein